MSVLMDGRTVARAVRRAVKERAQRLWRDAEVRPHLAAVLIGDDPASQTYVAMKRKACEWVEMRSSVHTLGSHATQQQAEALIDALNADSSVHGILLQHPVPRGLDETALLDRIAPAKDVDGLSRESLGSLLSGRPGFVACTPLGIAELLDHYHIQCEGLEAAVVGRSVILGKPMALLLLARNATVTVCHTRTRDLASVTRRADILVAAAGSPEMITADMVKPGAVVIDAGYSRVAGRNGDVGDVHFESVSGIASHITPVPGGVGPMTIAMLLRNTVGAAEAACSATRAPSDGRVRASS